MLVALGVPLQDVWIARNRARLVAGVGAQFDFWSGSIARAPLPMRRLGIEWLWRLALEQPGLAGLWQVSGRAEIGFSKMVHMDTAYVRSRSILLDCAIIALTLRAVVTGRGA